MGFNKQNNPKNGDFQIFVSPLYFFFFFFFEQYYQVMVCENTRKSLNLPIWVWHISKY